MRCDDHRLRVPDPWRRADGQGRSLRPLPVHVFLRRNVAPPPLALPSRTLPSQNPRKGKRHLNLQQLALFFAAWNAFFIPVIWFFYPETSGRSLEEIDLIFAKGYVEKINYVRAAKELPRLTDEEIEAKAAEYGILDDNEKTEERVMERDPAATAEFSSFQPTQL